ncbi:pyridine nucleotide-disulfide oxidoreductase-domain-containing protein [Sphaerosporella brunnea]|uniref:Pyridine nucleotide-disulfide oxidoreductase-domain-containing protein n=1 Tax=Sphaerosporella brunnea TaxID=1250544 RepID=A0A5J5F1U5_9PEZI|nr:pyridine nucleotide-disulfide oxidoreductase-domain-containing protein [Sphaerosporella brunnea]
MSLALSRRTTLRRLRSLFPTATSTSPATTIPASRRWLSLRELDAEKQDRERVVILGSGWGGFGVARSIDTKYYQPILVTPRTYFVFTPLLAGTAVGTLEFRNAMESSHSLKGVEVVRGYGVDWDPASKSLTVEGIRNEADPGKTFQLPYDKLVLSVGAYAQTFGIPGVRENAFFLKDVNDARRIRSRILARFEEASLPDCSEQDQRRLLHFAIVGGGPTGIEFAAELHDLLEDDLSRIYPVLVNKADITVYDVAPVILGMFDNRLQGYAQSLFRRQGIRVKTNHNVLEVKNDGLVTKEDGHVPAGMVVWSTGLATNPFVKNTILGKGFKLFPDDPKAEELKVCKSQKAGQILVDTHLRVLTIATAEGKEKAEPKPLDDVFALGDCAAVGTQGLPATAQVANQQAKWLAKSLNNAAKGASHPVISSVGKRLVDIDEEREFGFRSLGIMAYLGGWRAITQSGGTDLKGRLAWLLWRTAYFSKSVGWRNKVLIPVYWFLNWILGRDINRF